MRCLFLSLFVWKTGFISLVWPMKMICVNERIECVLDFVWQNKTMLSNEKPCTRDKERDREKGRKIKHTLNVLHVLYPIWRFELPLYIKMRIPLRLIINSFPLAQPIQPYPCEYDKCLCHNFHHILYSCALKYTKSHKTVFYHRDIITRYYAPFDGWASGCSEMMTFLSNARNDDGILKNMKKKNSDHI